MDLAEASLIASGSTAVLFGAKLLWIPAIWWMVVFAPVVLLALFCVGAFLVGMLRWYALG